MKFRLLFSLLLSGFFMASNAQSPIGLIGSAVPVSGWASDTNMVKHPDSLHIYTISIDLQVGAIKFRARDAWAKNWGDVDFPVGIGKQGGGDIPIDIAGRYDIWIDTLSGAYEVMPVSDIGLIGTASVFGWGRDANLMPLDTANYRIIMKINEGACKFRLNDDWATSWGPASGTGAAGFPANTGVTSGAEDIQVPAGAAGKYQIDFNKITGVYKFTLADFSAISIIGSGGIDWNTDILLNKLSADLWGLNVVTLKDGEIKFRANQAWNVSWGDTTFPTGVGIPGGPNIKCTAGDYKVSFNTKTLEYKFLPIVYYTSVGLIGDATANGWGGPDIDLEKDLVDPSIWRVRTILKTGEAKFRANDAWVTSWGGPTFPIGIATSDNGPNIPIDTGEYKITFNTTTGDYNFEKLVIFASMGMAGPATPAGNWPDPGATPPIPDVDMVKNATDETIWHAYNVALKGPDAGPGQNEMKFRAEDGWAKNWGPKDGTPVGDQFPIGVGIQDGKNILVQVSGNYDITLKTATGEYAFLEPSSTVDIFSPSVLALAPNPTGDFVNIELKEKSLHGEALVQVISAKGQTVFSQKMDLQNVATINASTFAPGLYVVQISGKKFTIGKQLLIAR